MGWREGGKEDRREGGREEGPGREGGKKGRREGGTGTDRERLRLEDKEGKRERGGRERVRE